jgi:hypothetical protein
MDEILNSLQIYGQERAAVVLFAGILVLCTSVMVVAAGAKVLGRRALVALVWATAMAVVVYRVTQ